MTQTRALLFDLGGVVIEIDFGRTFAHWSTLSSVPTAELRSRFGVDTPYEQHERGEIDANAYFASLRDSLGLALHNADMLDGWNALFIDEVDGIRELLIRVSEQLPTYGFSNTNAAHHRYFAPRFKDVLSPFRQLFVSSELGLRKPEPEAFRAVAGTMGVALDEILFFDDTEENVISARALGMQAVHVRSIDDVHSACDRLLPRV